MRLLLGRERSGGIEKGLVLAGRQGATLDAQLLHGFLHPVHPVSTEDHTDGTHDARLVHVDVVGGRGHVVGRRCAHLIDDGVHRLVRMLAAQTPDLVDDGTGLHRASTRTVDAQDHAHHALVIEGAAQGAVDTLGRDHFFIGSATRESPLDADAGHEVSRHDIFSALLPRTHLRTALNGKAHQGKEDQPEEYPPAAFGTLLLQGLACQFFHESTTPFGRPQGGSVVLFSHS